MFLPHHMLQLHNFCDGMSFDRFFLLHDKFQLDHVSHCIVPSMRALNTLEGLSHFTNWSIFTLELHPMLVITSYDNLNSRELYVLHLNS